MRMRGSGDMHVVKEAWPGGGGPGAAPEQPFDWAGIWCWGDGGFGLCDPHEQLCSLTQTGSNLPAVREMFPFS